MNINYKEKFSERHLGPDENETNQMLKVVGADSIEQLIEQTIPANIRLKKELDLPNPVSEQEFLANYRKIAKRNIELVLSNEILEIDLDQTRSYSSLLVIVFMIKFLF